MTNSSFQVSNSLLQSESVEYVQRYGYMLRYAQSQRQAATIVCAGPARDAGNERS